MSAARRVATVAGHLGGGGDAGASAAAAASALSLSPASAQQHAQHGAAEAALTPQEVAQLCAGRVCLCLRRTLSGAHTHSLAPASTRLLDHDNHEMRDAMKALLDQDLFVPARRAPRWGGRHACRRRLTAHHAAVEPAARHRA